MRGATHFDFDRDLAAVGARRGRSRRTQAKSGANQGVTATTPKVDPEPPEENGAPVPSVNGRGPGERTKPGRRARSASKSKPVDVKRSGRQSAQSRRAGTRTDVAREPAVKKELARLARTIRDHHEKCCGAFRTSLEHAIKAGAALASAKKKLGHGKFERWIQTECKFRPRTGRDYMKVAQAVADGQVDVEELKRRPAAVLAVKSILQEMREQRSGQARTSTESTADEATRTACSASSRPSRDSADQPRRDPRNRQVDIPVSGEPVTSEPTATALEPEQERAADEPLQEMAPVLGQPSILDDAQWLATMPLRSKLQDPTTFDGEALRWRRVQPVIDLLLQIFTPSAEDLRAAWISTWYKQRHAYAVAVLAGINPPDQWELCSRCGGSGRSGFLKKECDQCRGAGYAPTHQGDQTRRDGTDG
jgi:hypothetical protein